MSRRRSQTTFPAGQIKVVLFEGIHNSAKAFFERAEFTVVEVSGALPEDELIRHLADAQVVGIRSKTQLTAKVLESAKLLLCVGCFCIGTNQVDLEKANALGIPVFNAPFSNTRSVAELIIAEIVMLARRLGDCVKELHEHTWNKSASGCHEVRGKTVGVVGYGHIGSQVGVLAEGFGMSVLFYDIAKRLPMGNNKEVESLDALLSQSDFVTFHVPATPETKDMIQAEHLAKMQPGSYLLNASRGSVINLEALADAVKRGHIAGAAIDVYPKEPRSNGNGFESPLVGLPNIVLTPHIGGSTEEAQESIGEEVAASCQSFVIQGTTSTAVNFPHVEQQLRPNRHRVLNVHQNVPGVMAEILAILADHNANIHAQQLGTDDTIGYLLTDLDMSVSDDVKAAIAALPTSIKTRILY
tara:strand:- start:12376 stop:13614 length:1239 start_codon:yes stop_codon:yes gene_type:complete